MRAATIRLHHVQLASPLGSEELARRFFGELLGLREIPKPANLARRGGVWFELEDGQLHIGIEREFRPAEKAHPAFSVPDLEALRRRLGAAGIETWEDEPYPGRDRFYTRDPFGNRLEFLGPERSGSEAGH
jgi:catechol 2,3-dioxygenase-like lactoylglutathione lyase family enzyme